MKPSSNIKWIALVCSLALSGIAYAHTGAKGVVKQRMDMMGEIADSMKTLGRMVKGEAAYDAQSAEAAAKTIGLHMSHMRDLFPEGSADAPSEALPAIWENWEEFMALSEKLEVDAEALARTAAQARTADALVAPFGRMGRSCGSCHEKFRLKK